MQHPHMWTGQELLHDVHVVNLSAAAQSLLFGVQLLVVFNLKQTNSPRGQVNAAGRRGKVLPLRLNLNKRDYAPNLSSFPMIASNPTHTRHTRDLLLRRTWAVVRPRQSHSYRSLWKVGNLKDTETPQGHRGPFTCSDSYVYNKKHEWVTQGWHDV